MAALGEECLRFFLRLHRIRLIAICWTSLTRSGARVCLTGHFSSGLLDGLSLVTETSAGLPCGSHRREPVGDREPGVPGRATLERAPHVGINVGEAFGSMHWRPR